MNITIDKMVVEHMNQKGKTNLTLILRRSGGG